VNVGRLATLRKNGADQNSQQQATENGDGAQSDQYGPVPAKGLAR
jgi:hypothetical protein